MLTRTKAPTFRRAKEYRMSKRKNLRKRKTISSTSKSLPSISSSRYNVPRLFRMMTELMLPAEICSF